VTDPLEDPAKARADQDRTLSDLAYEQVLSMIVDGQIAVGAKLPTENRLSEQLGVSRPVLRKALKQLRKDAVIVSRQGSGSYVSRRPDEAVLTFAQVGSIADIQRVFEFRAAIEGEASALAAIRRSETDLKKIKSALDELDRCIRDGDLGVEADEDFHAAICNASENHYFTAARASMRSNILAGLNLTRNLSLTKTNDRLQLVQREHYVIYSAMLAKDASAARIGMRTHIENARMRVFEGDKTD